MRSLASRGARRISGSRNFRSAPQKDFCNKIRTFRTWPRWPAMSAVGGPAEVVAGLVAIIEGWLDSLVASPKIFRTYIIIVNEGPLLPLTRPSAGICLHL